MFHSGLSCGCLNGWKKLTDKGGFSVKCEKCPDNQKATSDGWGCIACESGCDTCGPNEILSKTFPVSDLYDLHSMAFLF